jgi:methyl-accepting chemotaxis protein
VERIDDRLAFFGLDAAARRRLRRLRRVIHAAMGPSLARFYTVVRANPTMRSFFSDDRQMDSAKDRQITHWDHLTEATFDAAYLKAVRKVGGIHARIGLEPRWYIGGYALILEGVTNRIVRRYSWSLRRFMPGGASSLAADIATVVKAALLDMDLSISIYLENLDGERQRLETEQRQTFEELSRALQQIGRGDLTVSVSDRLSQATSFNPTFAALCETIAGIRASVTGVSGAADEISQASNNLARRTEQQAASLEQTAAATDMLTKGVHEAAGQMKRVNKSVVDAGSEAEAGNAVAARTHTAMSQIADSSREVGQIIGVIDEIAFQTNLLALNAAVEAARAGDAGRGFAVVASEVRALTHRSSDAAKSIKLLIDKSSAHVSDGEALVAKTERALTQIVTATRDIGKLMQEMASAADIQAGNIAEINTTVGHLDTMTQQNAAMAEQATAASDSLSSEAQQMLAMVSGFRTDNEPMGRGYKMAV